MKSTANQGRIVLLAVLLALAGCQVPIPQKRPPAVGPPTVLLPGKLEIHIIDVGQADAILIRCPEGTHEMLIDAGDTRYPASSTKFKAFIGAQQSKTNPIEVVIASHPHADHIGSMEWVIENYTVGLYVDNGMDYDSATYRNLAKAILAKQVPHKRAQDSQVPMIDFCPLVEVSARILRPNGFAHDTTNANNVSVIVRVDCGARSFLFVGDAETEEEEQLIKDPVTRAFLDCDLLKAGHHGSDTSSGKDFLAAVTPKIVAVSCGEKETGTNKQYKHPRAGTIEAFLSHTGPREGPPVSIDAFQPQTGWKKVDLNRAVYVTQGGGDILFECDGTSIHRKP